MARTIKQTQRKAEKRKSVGELKSSVQHTREEIVRRNKIAEERKNTSSARTVQLDLARKKKVEISRTRSCIVAKQ